MASKAQFQFEWIFAIIVGAAILFIVIYALSGLISGGRNTQGVEFSKQFSILFDPLTAGVSEGSATSVLFKEDARLYTKCISSDLNGLGREDLGSAIRSSLFQPWKNSTEKIPIHNYIFSDSVEEGRTFYLFSKPFNMPFKVADLVYVSTEKFCFISPPEEVKKEVTDLKIGNINVSDTGQCLNGTKKVCFGYKSAETCDIVVYGSCADCDNLYSIGYVQKKGKNMYFADSALMYAGIFSSPENYECNLKRLMAKLSWLTGAYKDKSVYMSQRGCDVTYNTELDELASSAKALNASSSIGFIYMKALEINNENENAICKVY